MRGRAKPSRYGEAVSGLRCPQNAGETSADHCESTIRREQAQLSTNKIPTSDDEFVSKTIRLRSIPTLIQVISRSQQTCYSQPSTPSRRQCHQTSRSKRTRCGS
jgi:hypothetical protein